MNDAGSKSTLRAIRIWLRIFMLGLVVSGITAFPLYTELTYAQNFLQAHGELLANPLAADFASWVERVAEGLAVMHAKYPFIAYGTDWLAFAHLVIAAAFVGPFKDPQRNVWVIHWGMFACVAIIPLALIAGPVRGLPLGWTLIDISFGVLGIIPLLIVKRLMRRLAPVAGGV